MSRRFFTIFFLVIFPVADALAVEGYTYIKSSLAFPWIIFYLIGALIAIPFVLVIVLTWLKSSTKGNIAGTDDVNLHQTSAMTPDWVVPFNRIVLPLLLVVVAVVSVLLIMNAFEAMDLMESNGTAAPTMLNARP